MIYSNQDQTLENKNILQDGTVDTPLTVTDTDCN